METMHDDEMEIDLMEIFYALKKRIFMILAVGLLCGCLSCVYTKFFMTPVYTSTSSLLVLTKETTLSSLADLQMGSQLTKDYTVLTTSREVLQEVIENQGLDISYKALKSCITLDNPTDTRILNVSVTYPDAEKAKAIVDELANVASAYIGDKMEVIPPKIIEDGEIPTVQTSPSMSKNTMLGLLAGLILSAGIVVVITIMNDSIKTILKNIWAFPPWLLYRTEKITLEKRKKVKRRRAAKEGEHNGK